MTSISSSVIKNNYSPKVKYLFHLILSPEEYMVDFIKYIKNSFDFLSINSRYFLNIFNCIFSHSVCGPEYDDGHRMCVGVCGGQRGAPDTLELE